MHLCSSGLIVQFNESLVCKLWMNDLTKHPFSLQTREKKRCFRGGTHAPLYESVRKREGGII